MFFHDTRYAFRSISRQPTFAAMAILTLVLGIGANTAIFGVVKAVLLNRLPYEKPSGLVVLWEQNPNGSPDLVAPLTFKDWQSQSRAIESMAAYRSIRRSEEHTSELQSRENLVCRLLLEKKKK